MESPPPFVVDRTKMWAILLGILINVGGFALYWMAGGATCGNALGCSVVPWLKTAALIVGGGTMGFTLIWRAVLPGWCCFLGISIPLLTLVANVLTTISAA